MHEDIPKCMPKSLSGYELLARFFGLRSHLNSRKRNSSGLEIVVKNDCDCAGGFGFVQEKNTSLLSLGKTENALSLFALQCIVSLA